MLKHLRANDDRFKTVSFKPGLNILVAEKTSSSIETDSRNGVGKSSLIQVLHHLLGGKLDAKSYLKRPELQQHAFELQLDWPRTPSGILVRRSIQVPNEILVSSDVLAEEPILENTASYSLTEWQRIIERDLFQLPDEHLGISGRSLLSFYMRRVSSNAFNDAIKTNPQQSPAEASANIAYLLGLDWQLASRYRNLSERESTRRRLAQAAKDPVWGRIVGRSSELRGQMTVAQQRVNDLERQIQSFEVVPEYENLQNQADEITRRIRKMRDEDIVDRRNLHDYELALGDSAAPDMNYLAATYAELGVVLGDAVRRRYDEVEEFHQSVVRNRRIYLKGEISALRQRLATREDERLALGDRQASILRSLNEGGALDALTALQSSLAQERASLEAMRHRYEAAVALEGSAAEIKAERGRLESETRMDLREREHIIADINVRFLEYATRLYGHGREAYLDIEPAPSHLRISPHIDSLASRGIGNMVIFCFDLTVAVTAHRSGRGPDFLIHDSHLFDGVDERQLSRALALAKEVAEAESLQYIVTMNSDDLAKASAVGSEFSSSIIEPRLTDDIEDGGLFGFRFA